MKWKVIIPIISLLMVSGCLSNLDSEKINESNYTIKLEYHSSFIGVGSTENLDQGITPYLEINLSNAEMDLLKEDDDNSLMVQSWETQQEDGQPYLLVHFSSPDELGEIIIKWKGYGRQPFMGDIESTTLIYVFNYREDSWEENMEIKWDDEFDIKDKVILIRISDMSSYLSDTNTLSTLIFGPYGGGDSTGTLKTEVLYAKGRE